MRSPAIQRYTRRTILLSIAYAVFLLGAVYLFRHAPPHGALVWIVALLPALPIVGVFVAIGALLVEEQDEYLRMMFVRQTLYASAFALSIATVWGFLESFELVDHVEAYYVAVLWFGGLGLGACINRLTGGPAL